MRAASFLSVLLIAASLAVPVFADLEPLTPAGTLPDFETFEHLAMNQKGQFVAVSDSQIFVGDAPAKKITHVYTGQRVNFVLTDMMQNAGQQVDFGWVGTRLAINEKGDYIVASNTWVFAGNTSGGEPKRVYENAEASFQRVLINDAGHYLAVSSKSLVGGKVGDAAATVLLPRCIGLFDSHGIGVNGTNWTVSVGEIHAALSADGRFVAISSGAVYAGSVPGHTAAKVYESGKTDFRHVQISSSGDYIVVTAKTVYRGRI